MSINLFSAFLCSLSWISNIYSSTVCIFLILKICLHESKVWKSEVLITNRESSYFLKKIILNFQCQLTIEFEFYILKVPSTQSSSYQNLNTWHNFFNSTIQKEEEKPRSTEQTVRNIEHFDRKTHAPLIWSVGKFIRDDSKRIEKIKKCATPFTLFQ